MEKSGLGGAVRPGQEGVVLHITANGRFRLFLNKPASTQIAGINSGTT